MNQLPRGLRNNNPLNIRRNPANHWQGASTSVTDKEFEQFVNTTYGLRAAFVIIHGWMQKRAPRIDTPTAIITRWAPPSENNTSSYIDAVCRIAILNPTERLSWSDKNKLCRLLRAMAIVENGTRYQDYLGLHLFETAYELAKRQ